MRIALDTEHYLPIHREAPAFVEQETAQQILVTGIKVFFLFMFLFFVCKCILSDLLHCQVTCSHVSYDSLLINFLCTGC